MSASGKGLGLATVVCLGVVTATIVWKYTASKGQQPTASSAGVKQRSAMKGDEAATASTATLAAPPLAIAPAPAGSKALIVCREGAEEASVAEQWATRSRGGGATVSVCPPGYLDSHCKSNSGAYDSIVVEAWEGLAEAALGEIVKLLKAGGKVNVAFQGDGDAAAAAAAVKRALTFAGFLRVAPCPDDARVLTGERAAWEAGASAPVRLSFGGGKSSETSSGSRNGGGVAASNGGGAKKTWKLALDDDDDDAGGDDLVDEDALLESSAPVKRATEMDGGGCATKRRACKGCSCGRAEMEMSGEANGNGGPVSVVSIGDADDALTSACGNCSKGDAFRCAGCPFLGKPAFEKGQEKTIMLSDLDAQQDD